MRRCSLEVNQQYAEAFQAQKGDTIILRLAVGTLVTVAKGFVGVDVIFLKHQRR